MINELNFRCCFCNIMIESTKVDPCDINILVNIDKVKEEQDNQSFYCHVECFKQKLHQNIKNLFVLDIV